MHGYLSGIMVDRRVDVSDGRHFPVDSLHIFRRSAFDGFLFLYFFLVFSSAIINHFFYVTSTKCASFYRI